MKIYHFHIIVINIRGASDIEEGRQVDYLG
jgi:hypothetical protein